jgi:hypothetical protein
MHVGMVLLSKSQVVLFYNFEIQLSVRVGVFNFENTEATRDFLLHDDGQMIIGCE